MAKQSGLGANLYTGVYDLSGDIGAVTQAETMRGTFDVTPIDKSAMERIVGRRDGAMAFTGFWNVSAGQEHPVLSALPRTDVISTLTIGSAVGSAAASMVAKQLNYSQTLGEDGSLGVGVNLQANGYGLEWGETLTVGKQSFATGTVSGTSINLGSASTAFGAAAYLHVFTMPSGTAAFTVQDSDDDSSFATVTGLAFTGITGATSLRLQTAAGLTVRQYVRIQGTGVHGTSTIVVNFVRYTEAGPV